MVTYNVSLENKLVLVTGAAGFIGANLVKRLQNEFDSVKVIGIDSITEYYDVRLKYERLQELPAYVDRISLLARRLESTHTEAPVALRFGAASA